MHRSTTAMLATLLLAAAPALAHAQLRPEVSGTSAAVTAGHPLAAAAGAEVLRRGGNAVDAAVTMAGVLAVVRPHMNGVGGDAFLLIRDASSGEVHALNGSGRAGSGATLDALRARGLEELPTHGVLSVSVPGAVQAWEDALARFGTITLAEALEPAIRYAETGFPVSEKLAADIEAGRRGLEEDPAMAAVYLGGGEPPVPGTLLRQPDLARTLRRIARGGADAFYRGELAAEIARFLRSEGGLITGEDLAGHASTWQRPLETRYLGARVLAFPPNTQGMALLEQLNLAEHVDLAALGHDSPAYVHALVSMKQLAFADRDRAVTDPEAMQVPVERLISKEYARSLVPELERRLAPAVTTDEGPGSRGGSARPEEAGARKSSRTDVDSRREGEDDTVFLSAVDADGNAVALIQSLFHAFGSGRMVPGTGIILHNRGSLFSLDPSHVNVVAPGKRTYHTLSPHMALRGDGELLMVFGTPGGDGQTQTLTQVFHHLMLFGMTPQEAVEAPRWRSYSSGRLALEPALAMKRVAGVAKTVAQSLRELGHDVEVRDAPGAEFGNAQVIFVDPRSGALRTGADFRREGYAVAW